MYALGSLTGLIAVSVLDEVIQRRRGGHSDDAGATLGLFGVVGTAVVLVILRTWSRRLRRSSLLKAFLYGVAADFIGVVVYTLAAMVADP